ncbi:hypothetical protein X777_07988 [Ooceraea biroi]|uniref:Uncharacterized protein n=1 Tax=Ooceraea biroi TaxID=2015173 RepID=A0A026WCU7_OOCBI|nr:hypothetical protein X777_07988 [Ooceraea biroi]
MEVNIGKTKILRFRKGGGREKKVSWRWKGKVIEEVKEYKYLGYVKKCGMCGKEEETWEYVWEKCRDWRGQERGGWMESVERILGGEGEGEEWLRELEKERGRGKWERGE